ncbi:thymidine kinase [Deinococcus radiotolerans]|uniref:Thymidine kinase n=1 Tax=Deinococcus radiotolerans TaxID=1309407 RepID=A0ABQ2FFG2_9DEIO|nr:thymidine kinase [Deinococcus radiotolerans]GGK93222.1 thymidine kinase [Deinococcus radiotolerans]
MLRSPYHGGHLEVIVGPMFSGKSEELIRRVTRAVIARQRVQVFKPALDDRYHESAVASHAGRTVNAVAVRSARDIRAYLSGEGSLLHAPGDTLPDVIGIDEVQFLDAAIIPLALELADAGVRVILAGLDQDFRAEPFGFIPELLARAESVEKLTAICTVCGAPATRSQRLIGGQPAHFDDPVVLVGAEESYEARCRVHHVLQPSAGQALKGA